ncbi:SRPBCC family protein [Haloechinothrix halophila]|uniref:SRPBCC family protein n=1 Tax=Haloechinothrix halophila TaxID=1069073 RepID=UPI0004080DA0|nr:SRPBCC family protein [Haloechinothrix halophila]
MTEYTRSSITIDATPGEIMDTIADFASYPEWAGEVTATEIMEPGHGGRPARVRLIIDGGAIRDDQTHIYRWDGDHAVYWSLASSRLLRSLEGSYLLEPRHTGGTAVTYQLRLDAKVPMLGVFKREVEKVVIDRALFSLKRHIETHRSGHYPR